ncbi:MAG: hypothetical protein ACRDFS_08445 [Chloroflexota bacterium]
MPILNHFAQAAAILLLGQLIVLLLVFAVIAGLVVFGLRFGRRRSQPGLQRANSLLAIAQSKVHQGTDMVARPVIALAGATDTMRATAMAIRHKVRGEPEPEPLPPTLIAEPTLLAPPLRTERLPRPAETLSEPTRPPTT